MKQKTQTGFTLIEIMVVLSIISLLSSIFAFSFTTAKAKAFDSKKIAEANSVKSAVALYYLDHKAMPPTYQSGPEVEDTSNPNNPANAYNMTMQALVSGHYLGQIPHSPDAHPYSYTDYGPGNPFGATFTVMLNNPSKQPLAIVGVPPLPPNACFFVPQNPEITTDIYDCFYPNPDLAACLANSETCNDSCEITFRADNGTVYNHGFGNQADECNPPAYYVAAPSIGQYMVTSPY